MVSFVTSQCSQFMEYEEEQHIKLFLCLEAYTCYGEIGLSRVEPRFCFVILSKTQVKQMDLGTSSRQRKELQELGKRSS